MLAVMPCAAFFQQHIVWCALSHMSSFSPSRIAFAAQPQRRVVIQRFFDGSLSHDHHAVTMLFCDACVVNSYAF